MTMVMRASSFLLLVLLNVTHAEIAVIGAGVAGLTAACELRRLGHEVTLFAKNSEVGGRAKELSINGFTWDLGPSWYWMPELYDKVFERFGYKTMYNITRLDPAYRVITSKEVIDVPGTTEKFIIWSNETKLKGFFEEVSEMYEHLLGDWLWRPMQSPAELFDPTLMWAGLRYNLIGSLRTQIQSYVSSDMVRTILEWPVIFVGLSPKEAPALWSFLSYCSTNTFYPEGGLSAPIKMLEKIALEKGVKIRVSSEVTKLKFMGNRVSEVCTKDNNCSKVQGVVAAADYHHVEQKLLPYNLRRYGSEYWQKQVLSPSCVLFYLGFNRRLPNLLHHTFYFDTDLEKHLEELFTTHEVSESPTFYVSATSKTDRPVAPSGGETLFVLVPFTYTFDHDSDTPQIRNTILELVLKRMFPNGFPAESLVHKSSYGPSDFHTDYNAFRGNAFGHANTMSQSFFLKPLIQSKASNLFFAGQLTHPGPGMPPAMISGIIAAELLHQQLNSVPTWSAIFLACYFLFILIKFASIRVRSYFRCIGYFYTGGRTYFAATTLMDACRFLDTAAMYALFRVTDDFVDNEIDTPEQKKEKLAEFERNFWSCMKEGVGRYDLHPIFPAVIETSKRRKYEDRLFNDFFRSMRMDEGEVHVCEKEADTYQYMEGSAAVIGEFMLPMLEPDETLHEGLIQHARDLGRAFQMTNFLRDISEDLDLGRQYVPEEFCRKHNVVLSAKDSTQPGWSAMMEEMFAYTDKFYASADVGVSRLPSQVRDVINVARKMYHEIHAKIRDNNYDVFQGKLRLPFCEKMRIASKELPRVQILRIVLVEFISLLVWNAHLLFVLAWAFFMTSFDMEAPTYLQFHLIFTLPVMLWVFPSRNMWKETSILACAAFTYTTPWDNLLIYMSGWSYFPDRVLLVIGYVPIEEYAFFVIETVIVCGICSLLIDGARFKSIPMSRSRIPILVTGFLGLILGVYIGLEHFYLGSLLCWCIPALLIQYCYSIEAVLRHKWLIMKTTGVSTLYLSVIDHWGISHGTWSVDDTVFDVYPGLPFEELAFFFVTSLMCSQGMVLVWTFLPGFITELKSKVKKSD